MKYADIGAGGQISYDSSVVQDDRYLVEISDRLQRLRSLLEEQEKAASSTRRWLNKKRSDVLM